MGILVSVFIIYSGIKLVSSGYTNTADGVYTKTVSEAKSYSFSITDNVGNIGGCSVTVAKKQMYGHAI